MNKIFILILVLQLMLFGQKITFSKSDIKKIDNSHDKNYIYKRYDAYLKLLKETKNLTNEKKLIKINTFFNQTLPEYDNDKYNYDEYWATPKEFLINARGDCEDYVISKYFTLIEQDISKENLYLMVVKVKGATDYHMVLLYKQNNEFLVMDNLSFRILPLSKRVDLTPLFAFNEFGYWSVKNNKLDRKMRMSWGKKDLWQDLLNRVYKLKE